MVLLRAIGWTCKICKKKFKSPLIPSLCIKVGKDYYDIPICNKCVNIMRGGVVLDLNRERPYRM